MPTIVIDNVPVSLYDRKGRGSKTSQGKRLRHRDTPPAGTFSNRYGKR